MPEDAASGPESPATAKQTGWLGARSLGWAAAVCIGATIATMIWLSLAAPNEALPAIPGTRSGPPWWPHKFLPPLADFVAANWIFTVLGCLGVLAGLAAVARGARPRPRSLLAAATVAVATLTVLPPAGSSDLLNYAAYGRMVVLGVNPYLTTPHMVARKTHDPVEKAAVNWSNVGSVYGPTATAEQWAAAELGGTSPGRITFWLKLWNGLAFLAVALALDRRLRSDRARRLRAHLLWTLNPLLLWALVAAGHTDGLATTVGFAGVLVLTAKKGSRAAVPQAFAAGILTALATDLKINFVLFLAGAAVAVWRSRAQLAAVIAAAVLVLVPSFAIFGTSAVNAILLRGGSSTEDTLYRLLYAPFGYSPPALPGSSVLAGVLFAVVTVLALRWMPDTLPEYPAVRPILALSLAWLLTWPFQRPWYDAMALCLLALYPAAAALDWIVVIRLAAGTLALMPMLLSLKADQASWFTSFMSFNEHYPAPVLRLLALIGFAALCWWYAVARRSRTRPG